MTFALHAQLLSDDAHTTAGPLIATIIDAVGITIYFQIAIFLLKRFWQG